MDFEEAFNLLDTAVVAKKQRHLKDIEVAILRESWHGKKYHEIAQAYGYTAEYLKQDVGPKLWKLLSEILEEKVSKTNFQVAIERRWRSYKIMAGGEIQKPKSSLSNYSTRSRWGIYAPTPREAASASMADINPKSQIQNRSDWGEAMDVSVFYGRKKELAVLEDWIVRDRCCTIALLGMGGIGKTALAIRSAEQLQNEFECIIWRSLHNPPPVGDLLADLIQFLSNGRESNLADSLDYRLSRLIYYLRLKRCLIVLDRAETILHGGASPGDSFAPTSCDREGYGKLIKQLGEVSHQSCLMITSREKPKEITCLEGKKVRCLHIDGLEQSDIQKIFSDLGIFSKENELKIVIESYSGHPLVLKIVATMIRDLMDGDIAKFIEYLKQGRLLFDDIRNIFEEHFTSLTNLEKEVMYWLAINRQAVSLSELQVDIVSPLSQRELPDTLNSLIQRSLIQRSASGFTQQPLVMEYITEKLIEQVSEEIKTKEIAIFNNHALLKATAKDYVRETQLSLIVKPVIKFLLTILEGKLNLEKQLIEILANIRENSPLQPGYAAGNALNILGQLNTDLSGHDFSYLTVWQAYLKGINLYQLNLSHSDIAKSVFAEN